MKPVITAVTLGVRDLRASLRFYEALGFKRKVKATGDEIAFLDAGSVALILWHWNLLAEDEGLPANPVSVFRGSNLAWNCKTAEEVDAVLARALSAGAKPLRQAEKTDYGGYRAYFADPDGHAWEVVCAPGFGFTDDGRLILPD